MKLSTITTFDQASINRAIKLSGISTWSYDIAGNNFRMDGNIADMLGFDEEIYEPEKSMEFLFNNLYKEDRELVASLFTRWKDDSIDEYEEYIRGNHKNGSLVWFKVNGYVVARDAKGKALTTNGVIMNVDKEFKTNQQLGFVFESIQFEVYEYLVKEDTLIQYMRFFTPKEFTNRSIHYYADKFILDADRDNMVDKFNGFINGSVDTYDVEYRVKTNSESEACWINAKGFVTKRNELGEIERFTLIRRDISSSKIYKQSLEYTNFKLKSILDSIENCIIELDNTGEIIYINEMFASIMECSLKNINDTKLAKSIKEKNFKVLKMIAQNNRKSNEMMVVDENIMTLSVAGREHLFNWKINVYFDMNGEIEKVLGIGNDITEQIKEKERLDYELYHDGMLGIHNKNYLMKRLNELDNDRIIIAIFDVKNMTIVNDTYGYEKGDLYLKAIAERVMNVKSQSINCIARLSGDKIAVLLLDPSTPNRIDERINCHVENFCSEDLVFGGISIKPEFSVGYSVYPDDIPEKKWFLSFIQTALKDLKKSKDGGTVRFTEKDYSQYRKRTFIVNDIQGAIDNREFEMYYQPIVVDDSKTLLHEALIRWNHPRKGFMLPGDFIEIVENSRYIIEIAKQTFLNVLKQINEWNSMTDKNVVISFNLSPICMQTEGMAQYMVEAMERHKVGFDQIHVEITETVSISVEKDVLNNIKLFKSKGIKISIDDFGMEYSTLSKLKEIDFDIIKIDRAFTQTEEDFITQSILKMLIDISKKLGKECIVEGVETIGQLDYMKSIGFDVFQGYYFYRPMPAGKITELIKEKYGDVN